jgi:hypothetical protein
MKKILLITVIITLTIIQTSHTSESNNPKSSEEQNHRPIFFCDHGTVPLSTFELVVFHGRNSYGQTISDKNRRDFQLSILPKDFAQRILESTCSQENQSQYQKSNTEDKK